MDKIAQWLQREGLSTHPAYLSGSALLLGQQFELPPYQVIYRIEADVLIICGFSRVADSPCQPQRLFHLWGVLRRLFSHYPQLKQMQMLVITEVINLRCARHRHQLVQLLIALGATFTLYDGDNWLVLGADKIIHRRFQRRQEEI